ncbi:hypothetical protein B0H10DRAFT_2190770, partial [Mycena sp. CBHHK59/15]
MCFLISGLAVRNRLFLHDLFVVPRLPVLVLFVGRQAASQHPYQWRDHIIYGGPVLRPGPKNEIFGTPLRLTSIKDPLSLKCCLEPSSPGVTPRSIYYDQLRGLLQNIPGSIWAKWGLECSDTLFNFASPTPLLKGKPVTAFPPPVDRGFVNPRTQRVEGPDPPGWVVWGDSVSLYKLPDATRSTFQPWETSIQLLENEPFEALRPTLISNKEPDKQRALAEFIAGLIGGSKHWPLSKQHALWQWFSPIMLKTDTVTIWASFLEYVFHNKDPRRLQPLVDHLINLWANMDYEPELAFDATKIFSIFKAFYEELNLKFAAWTDKVVERCWKQLDTNDHEDVRAFIAEVLAFSSIIKAQPHPSHPTTEVFLKECRTLPIDHDIMGMRGIYHKQRVTELVERFHLWREKRIPGVRAFQSVYDRSVWFFFKRMDVKDSCDSKVAMSL